MGDVVNLNHFRKARAASDQRRQASQNRVRFGRTKSELELARVRADLVSAEFEAKRLDQD